MIPARNCGANRGLAAEQSVALDRAGITVIRGITFLAAGQQVNAVVRQKRLNPGTLPCVVEMNSADSIRTANHVGRTTG